MRISYDSEAIFVAVLFCFFFFLPDALLHYLKRRLATTVLLDPQHAVDLFKLYVSVVSIGAGGGKKTSQLCRGLFKAV